MSLVVLVLSTVVVSSIVIGFGSVAAETYTEDHLVVNHTGESGNIYPSEGTQKLTDIKISSQESGNITNNSTKLYISLKVLKNQDVNISSVKIDSVSISNGNKTDSNIQINKDNAVLSIVIERSNISNPILINHLNITGLSTEDAELSSNLHYELGASELDNNGNFSSLKSNERTTNTTKFRIIGGAIRVPDQATGSTVVSQNVITTPGVTTGHVVANINSTIVITEGYKENVIAGIASQPNDSINGSQNISIKTPRLGGKVRAHLIPETHINESEYQVGEEIPNSTLNSSIGSDSAKITLGAVVFENKTYNESVSSNITISRGKLIDKENNDTPFVISLHPVTTTGDIIFDESIGRSRILTGDNENVNIKLTDESGNNSTIWNSNRFAAVIQLAENINENNSVSLESTSVLLNSDLDDQFMRNGISDHATITISENYNKRGSDELDVNYEFENEELSGERIYAGRSLAIKSNQTTSEPVELHRIENKNRSVVSGISKNIKNSSYYGFNTTKLRTSKYHINNNRPDTQFNIVGQNDQYLRIKNITGRSSAGGVPSFKIKQDTLIRNLTVTNLDDPSTNATIELTTPGESVSTVGLNTYAAGNASSVDDFVTTGSETTVESIATSTPNGTLPPGTYEVAVHSAEGTATTTNATTFTLHGRSTNDVVAYTADRESRSDLESAGAIRNAIADGTLSPSSTVSANETVVYAVDATGLTGLPAARNVTLDTGADLDRFDGFSFGVRRTSQSGDTELAATATDGGTIGSVPNRSSVHVDETGLYVVSNGEDALATETDPSDGAEYTAAFRVDDDRLRDASTGGSQGHVVTTDLTYVEPDTDGDQSDGGTDDTTRADGTGDDGGANTGGGGTGGGGETGDAGSGRGGGGTGSAVGSPGSGPADGGASPDDPPTETATRNRPDGTAVDSSPSERGSGPAPVADLRASYRDRPNVTVDAVSAEPGTDGAENGGASASGGTTSDSASADGRDVADAAAGGTTPAESSDETVASDDPAGSNGSFANPDAPGYDDAPIRSTAYDLPGFGPAGTLIAVTVATLLAARRRDHER